MSRSSTGDGLYRRLGFTTEEDKGVYDLMAGAGRRPAPLSARA
jgi:hypothetical protein